MGEPTYDTDTVEVTTTTASSTGASLAQARNFGVPLTLVAIFIGLYATEGRFGAARI